MIDIDYGKRFLSERLPQNEMYGMEQGGRGLVGASIISHVFARSKGTSHGLEQMCRDEKFKINRAEEDLVKNYAVSEGFWIENVQKLLDENYDYIDDGAEAMVYLSRDKEHVVKIKENTYTFLHESLDAIVLHNAVFNETKLRVIGFGYDGSGIFSIILRQPYIKTYMHAAMNFSEPVYNESLRYDRNRIILSDFKEKNVLIDQISNKMFCVDCIALYSDPAKAFNDKIYQDMMAEMQ